MKVLLRVIYYRNTEPLTLIWSSRFKIASIGNPWPIFYKNLRDNEIILKQSRQINTLKVYEGPANFESIWLLVSLIYLEMFRITPLLTVRGSYTCIRQSRKYLYEWKWNTDNLDKGILAIQNYKDAIPQEIYCITVIYNPGFDLLNH
jgi:hypothetical protein